MDLTEGQRLALCLAAQCDAGLSVVERALAGVLGETIEVRKEAAPGLVVGQCLTAAGRETLRAVLPEPTPLAFPKVVADVLRRLRGRGVPWVEVEVEAITWEMRPGYRVSWPPDSEAWRFFSRNSDEPTAAANRAELVSAAEALGLVVEAEAQPTLLVVAPEDKEPILIRRATLDRMLSPLDAVNARLDAEERKQDADWDARRDAARRFQAEYLVEHRVARPSDLSDKNLAEFMRRHAEILGVDPTQE